MKMKKVAYLSVLVLSLVLMSTSCCKEDDDPIVPDQITVQDLQGDWDFNSITINGTIYDEPCDVVALESYTLLTMNLRDVTATNLTITQNCVNNLISVNIKSFTNNTITLENDWAFKINNVEEFKIDKTILELKLVNNGGNTTLPLNAVYELER